MHWVLYILQAFMIDIFPLYECFKVISSSAKCYTITQGMHAYITSNKTCKLHFDESSPQSLESIGKMDQNQVVLKLMRIRDSLKFTKA